MYKDSKINSFFTINTLLKLRINYQVNSLSNSIKDLKNKLIFSTVDKASNNFCITCKLFYKEFLINEQLGNSTYTKLTLP